MGALVYPANSGRLITCLKIARQKMLSLCLLLTHKQEQSWRNLVCLVVGPAQL